MTWTEISFEKEAQYCEEATLRLETLGALAVSFFDAHGTPLFEPLPGEILLWPKVKIVALFYETQINAAFYQTLAATFPDTVFTTVSFADKEWVREWLVHFKPLRFGKNLWICPTDPAALSSLQNEKDAIIIKLDPGLAFGTGTHPTTALCLEWLANHPPQQQVVLDYGCGSGILGIAAALLGSKKIWSTDHDPQALLSTQENAQRNLLSLDTLSTTLPTALNTFSPKADVILANILANPLITLAPTLRTFCKIGGKIILSGLLTHQAAEVQAAYEPWFSFEAATCQEDWVRLVGTCHT